jgi:hypothetical protein
MLRHTLSAAAIGLMLVAGLARPVLAQDTTPVPIQASACANEPIAYGRMSAIIASPVASPAVTPEAIASPVPGLLPAGTPADDETAMAVHERVLILTACINANDLLRTLALYSDQFLSVAFGGQPIAQAAYDAEVGKTNPRPAGTEVVLYGFSDVVIAPDGRAVVSVLGDDLSSPRPPSYTLFYFVHEDGEWRIDATYDVGGDQPTG